MSKKTKKKLTPKQKEQKKGLIRSIISAIKADLPVYVVVGRKME